MKRIIAWEKRGRTLKYMGFLVSFDVMAFAQCVPYAIFALKSRSHWEYNRISGRWWRGHDLFNGHGMYSLPIKVHSIDSKYIDFHINYPESLYVTHHGIGMPPRITRAPHLYDVIPLLLILAVLPDRRMCMLRAYPSSGAGSGHQLLPGATIFAFYLAICCSTLLTN